MKYKINFDLEYTGSIYSEEEIIVKGYTQISSEILQTKISNSTVYGDYPIGYKFVTDIYENGTCEGENDVGSHDIGKWTIDFENNTFLLEWRYGWLDTITRAYDVNGNIEFYDVDSGKWRTTFKTIKKWDKK